MKALGVLLTAMLLVGCGVDYPRLRIDETARMGTDELARTRDLLVAHGSWDLEACIALALDENLSLMLADIHQRLATIDRRAAFGNFLPVVEVEATLHSSRYPMESGVGGSWMQVADRTVFGASVSVQQPILVPQAFVLYQMYREGEVIAELVAERTRQQIRHLVTGRFYAALAADEQVRVLRSALQRAQALLADITAFRREGLVTAAELAQAQAHLAVAEHALADAETATRRARSALLEAMGLHPLAEIVLGEAEPLPMPEGELPDLVLEAFLRRLELHIADREWGQARLRARLALVSWLPNLFGFGSLDYTSDSFVRRSLNATVGVGAVMNVLDGFRTVNAHRRAVGEQEAAVKRRDQQALAIALEVQAAWQQVASADRLLTVSAAALAAAEQAAAQSEAQAREGLLSPTRLLEERTALLRARSQDILARYQREVALATLIDVIGGLPQPTTTEP